MQMCASDADRSGKADNFAGTVDSLHRDAGGIPHSSPLQTPHSGEHHSGPKMLLLRQRADCLKKILSPVEAAANSTHTLLPFPAYSIIFFCILPEDMLCW